MDMQNVSNLQIPEGEVRTIHDKDGKLLWGKLSYDTKYKGDTTQQTYSGKNVAPVWYSNSDVSFSTNGGATRAIGDGVVTVTTSTTQATSGVYMSKNVAVNQNNYPDLFQEGNVCSFTIVADIESNFRFGSGNTHPTVSIGPTPTRLSFQTAISNTEFYIMNKTGATFTISEFQIEKNTTVATSYEPYVGGIASPNPAYPQTVNVVTGTQTITLSDGIISDDYTVGLGTIELCKIGTYQDYIYKSGDDWYVHKEIKKIVLDGSEGWSAVHNSIFYWVSIDGAIMPTTTTMPAIISNYYKADTYDNIYAGDNDYGIGLRSTQSYVCIRNKDCANVTALQTWLSNHNTTVYYALATPTDTQITDLALIPQLEAVHQFLTRYGYNAIVSGNLPIIIDKTDLS